MTYYYIFRENNSDLEFYSRENAGSKEEALQQLESKSVLGHNVELKVIEASDIQKMTFEEVTTE